MLETFKEDILFQSTLLMRGATINNLYMLVIQLIFQSTLLMRGATIAIHGIIRMQMVISIHAPHARSDYQGNKLLVKSPSDFNPRSSCEERRLHPIQKTYA